MSRTKIARRNYLAHKGLQFRYSATIFIATFAISVLAVWTTYLTTWTEISRQLQSDKLYTSIEHIYTSSETPQKNTEMINALITMEFSEVFDNVSLLLLVRLLVGSVILFVLSIFVSHKIAGPALRMERAAQALQTGDLTVDLSKLRLGDELGDLAAALHAALSRLRALVEECKTMASRVVVISKKIAGHIAHTSQAPGELKELDKELQIVASELVTTMERLKSSRQQGKK